MTAQEQVELTALILARNWQAVKNSLDLIHPDKLDAQGYFAKGFLFAFGPASQRNFADAIHCLETAHRLEPANIQYLNTLSEAYLQAKRPAIALRVVTLANNLEPGHLFSTIALGRAAWCCGEKELSISAFGDAYRWTPPNLSYLQ